MFNPLSRLGLRQVCKNYLLNEWRNLLNKKPYGLKINTIEKPYAGTYEIPYKNVHELRVFLGRRSITVHQRGPKSSCRTTIWRHFQLNRDNAIQGNNCLIKLQKTVSSGSVSSKSVTGIRLLRHVNQYWRPCHLKKNLIFLYWLALKNKFISGTLSAGIYYSVRNNGDPSVDGTHFFRILYWFTCQSLWYTSGALHGKHDQMVQMQFSGSGKDTAILLLFFTAQKRASTAAGATPS